MFGNGNLEYVLAQSNPHSSVRVELETEMRARKDLSREVRAVPGLNEKSNLYVLCRDVYHVVSDDYYLRSRDHLYVGDRTENNRTLRGNVKVPLVLPGYTPQNTTHMVEFTWDYSLEEFEEITGRLKPVTVIKGLRKGVHCDYPGPTGSNVPLVLAFDNLHNFDGAYSQFTEVSDETKIFDEIPFPEFKNFMGTIDAGNADFEKLLDFLSSHGPRKSFIMDALNKAERNVRIFMNDELRVDRDLIEQRIYPTISLDLYGNDFDKTRRLNYNQEA